MRFRSALPAVLSIVLMLLPSCRKPQLSDHIKGSLEELDGYVASRPVYETRKKGQLDALRRLLQASNDPFRSYDLCESLANEFFAYSFDSTQYYLKRCLALAEQTRDTEREAAASIALGHLYAKAGHFMEAYNRLFEMTDKESLSGPLRADYLFALYDFSRDLAGNSGMVERLFIPDRSVYREELYSLLPEGSDKRMHIRLDELVQEGRLESADSLCRILVARTDPNVHQYAICAYEMSEIAGQRGNSEEQMEWLIKSAECDIINSVKDYASLTMIAQHLVGTDVDRSFRYLRIAQEDALAYNAKLRPWQISQFFMGIESAYSDRQQKSRQAIVIASILLAVLTVILSLLTIALINRSRKLSRIRAQFEESNMKIAMVNATLNDVNARLSRADRVKEEFIVGFLHKLSDQIAGQRAEDNRLRNLLKQGKSAVVLKELDLSTRSEKSLKEYYHTFDITFLGLYPDFVEQFNALLREEERFYPKEGCLNTELRIFALIRLGVDDSHDIASILHYSLSTIYNYKVSVKNACLGDRDTFEHRVKMIGK
ncbi:MAG: hypothetical protein J6X71_04875 [Bacteroidales bacterium]|nr:hypothetical protein [Bacteroidales bacterium]